MKKIYFVLFIFVCFSLIAQSENEDSRGLRKDIPKEVITALSISGNYLDKREALETIEEDPSVDYAVNVLENIVYTRIMNGADFVYLRERALNQLCQINSEESQEVIKKIALIEENGYILAKALGCLGELDDPSDTRIVQAFSKAIQKALYGSSEMVNESMILIILNSMESLSDKGSFASNANTLLIDLFFQIKVHPNISNKVLSKANEVLYKVKTS